VLEIKLGQASFAPVLCSFTETSAYLTTEPQISTSSYSTTYPDVQCKKDFKIGTFIYRKVMFLATSSTTTFPQVTQSNKDSTSFSPTSTGLLNFRNNFKNFYFSIFRQRHYIFNRQHQRGSNKHPSTIRDFFHYFNSMWELILLDKNVSLYCNIIYSYNSKHRNYCNFTPHQRH